jgi:hypothetical protein
MPDKTRPSVAKLLRVLVAGGMALAGVPGARAGENAPAPTDAEARERAKESEKAKAEEERKKKADEKEKKKAEEQRRAAESDGGGVQGW